MAMFRYEAVDNTGKTLRGVMQASDQNDLAGKLQSRGFALKIAYNNSAAAAKPASTPITAGSSFSHPASVIPKGLQAVSIPPGVPVSVKSIVQPRLMALFLRQLTTMVTAGMPLSQSMRENLQYVRHPRLKAATSSMADSIEAGSRLSESMAKFPELFPTHLVGSVVCGELGGDIDEFLTEATTDYERESRDTYIGRFGWAMVKATLIQFWYSLPICFGTIQILMGLITGPQASTLTREEVIRAVLVHMSTVVFPVGTVATIAYIAFIYFWEAFKRRPYTRYILDYYRSRSIPWGTIHRNRSIARFLRSMDRLLSAGVDIGRAWEASALLCRDNNVGVALNKGYVPPGESTSIAERLSRTGVLKLEEEGLVNSGEKAGKVGESLTNLAASYEHTDTTQVVFGRFMSFSAFTLFSIIIAGILAIALTNSYSVMLNYFADDFMK